jgi:hypothetical protein
MGLRRHRLRGCRHLRRLRVEKAWSGDTHGGMRYDKADLGSALFCRVLGQALASGSSHGQCTMLKLSLNRRLVDH